VAYLAGAVTKAMLFRGGAADDGADPTTTLLDAYVEGLEKAVGALGAAVPEPREIFLSGRHADDKRVFERVRHALSRIADVRRLEGFSARTKAGAQGAAILADGLSGGRYRELVETLGVTSAGGTVLDHLRVIAPGEARNRLRLP